MNNKNKQLNGAMISEAFAAADRVAAQKGSKKRKVPLGELELAFAVVLVDLAACDQHFAPKEYQVISNGLRRLFSTPKERVKSLVNQANVVLANLRGTSRFAMMLRDNLDDDEKRAVMETIDDLIGTDGVEDGFETYLRTKFADLLGMPTELPAGAAK